MNAYLLDTNVVSEIVRPNPDIGVVTFLSDLESGWLSVITVHELEYGLRLLPTGRRRLKLESGIEQLLGQYQQFIIPIGESEAGVAARFRASRKGQGRSLHLADALIAASAMIRRLTLVTRNVDDFDGLDIAIHNPWTEQTLGQT